jgi:hypothetical protein
VEARLKFGDGAITPAVNRAISGHVVSKHVSELDHLKEEVGYLKFWQGITVVTDISVAGWLISSWQTAASYIVLFAVMGLIVLTAGIVFLHRRIERRMIRIKEL